MFRWNPARRDISIRRKKQVSIQMHNALFQWQFDCQIFVHYPWSKGNSINAIITSQLHFKRLTTYICNFSMFSNSTKQLAQNLRLVFNNLKIFFKMQLFFPNDYIIVLMRCLSRYYLRMKVPQLPRNSSEIISNWRTKLQGKFTKHL